MLSLRRSLPTLMLLLLGVAPASYADTLKADTPQTIPGLGTTTFHTSTKSPEAQTAFMRGLLLLHLFEYADAAKAFVAAEQLDPNFAMAYWGEAMTCNHGIWNQVDVAAGTAALAKFAPTAEARAAKIADARQKAYMAAIELLYDGSGTKVERDLRYAEAMEQMSASYPGDRNVQLFYALALLSQSEGVRDVPVYLKAAEISKAVFREEPANPGAAHYWIHGMDDPDHAAGALEAARALSKIAPDAPHAQHMCSHIFMALGMWDDVVQSNLEAIRVGAMQDKAAGFPPYNCGHYPLWLAYGYFQQGRMREAEQAVAACRQTDTDTAAWTTAHPGKLAYGAKDMGKVHLRLMQAYAEMHNMGIIESERWSDASKSAPEVATCDANSTAWVNFTTGFAEVEQKHLLEAAAALQQMRTNVEACRASPPQQATLEGLQALEVAVDELSGYLLFRQGSGEPGMADLRLAAKTYHGMAFAFGPPVTIKPPDELLGEVLLASGNAAGARAAFEQSLKRAPKRAESLLGLARAERMVSDFPAARQTYGELLHQWHAADADLPGLLEARKAVADSEP